MFMIQRLVLIQITILMIRCIYGNAKEIKTVDAIQNLQIGKFGRFLDQSSPFIEEHDPTPQGNTPAELLMKHARDNIPLNNDFAEEDKMTPELDLTKVSLTTQKDNLDKTTMNISEQTMESNYSTEYDPVDIVGVVRNETVDLLRAVTFDNRNLIMKMIKILQALKTLDEAPLHQLLESHPQTKSELLQTLGIIENISAVINNGIMAGMDNAPKSHSKPNFKPVKTIADVMALGKRQVSDGAAVDKRSFFCPLMYRTAFSVRRCWLFAKLVKRRQERMRKLALARQLAAKKKFVFSNFRRMTAAST